MPRRKRRNIRKRILERVNEILKNSIYIETGYGTIPISNPEYGMPLEIFSGQTILHIGKDTIDLDPSRTYQIKKVSEEAENLKLEIFGNLGARFLGERVILLSKDFDLEKKLEGIYQRISGYHGPL